MKKQVYKVGDRVQIVTTATDGHFGSLKGSVGKIIEIDLQHEYPYRVRLNKNSEGENLRLWSTVSPLKPKKSIKKMEKGGIGKRTGIKSRKPEIMELRDKGLTMRQIANKLGLKAHSVVAHYLKDQPPQKRIPLIKLSELLPKKRYPILEKDEVDRQSNAMTAGWNAYRDELLKIIYSL